MRELFIDIETYSPVNLTKAGVYPYAEHPEFDILLFGYAIDGGPVEVIDLICGQRLPDDVLATLVDPAVIKWAFNAQFEIESLNARFPRSVRARGHFPTEQAALTCSYLTLRSLNPTDKGPLR